MWLDIWWQSWAWTAAGLVGAPCDPPTVAALESPSAADGALDAVLGGLPLVYMVDRSRTDVRAARVEMVDGAALGLGCQSRRRLAHIAALADSEGLWLERARQLAGGHYSLRFRSLDGHRVSVVAVVTSVTGPSVPPRSPGRRPDRRGSRRPNRRDATGHQHKEA